MVVLNKRQLFHETHSSEVKGQNGSNFKQRQMAELMKPSCWPWKKKTCKCVHNDLVVRPTIKGSKVEESQNLKIFQMAKITVSTCSTWTVMQKCPR